ncbi:hypothetical protein [Corynebacterium ulceribovis]|uniref:hypothetical protein n=1 Tax=Corynebacterium ulceribovis TaxID=487732 RepID=UPI0012EAFB91|nr:hypothetical protein [Corynebacterium ulceribovis]
MGHSSDWQAPPAGAQVLGPEQALVVQALVAARRPLDPVSVQALVSASALVQVPVQVMVQVSHRPGYIPAALDNPATQSVEDSPTRTAPPAWTPQSRYSALAATGCPKAGMTMQVPMPVGTGQVGMEPKRPAAADKVPAC